MDSPISHVKKLKFTKKDNGTVLLQNTQDNSVVASFEPSMSLHRERGNDNRFRIASSTDDDGFLIDYRYIDCELCIPVIVQANVNEFLIELSEKYFFINSGKSGNSGDAINQNNFVRSIILNGWNLPYNYTKQDICDMILVLPAEERTILETDSKVNVIIDFPND